MIQLYDGLPPILVNRMLALSEMMIHRLASTPG